MKKNEDNIKKLKDPESWFDYYRKQKLIADILLEKLLSPEQIIKMKKDIDNSDFTTIFVNAHYHWGMAIENGLKGIIVKNKPYLIEYESNGQNVMLKSIGGKAGKTHNLLQLAINAGVFDTGNNLFKHESDYEHLEQVLLHLTDMIKWGARYPVSNNTSTIYKMTKKIQMVLVYGFHILDIMQPLFHLFEKESEKQSENNK
ncbi:hypothetical protein [Phnomibacter sp. MR]|uniref:hypothetical protein n=1 Tax=Phnomibacter sp. MR TaxID=3042318 RepID=UPI003A809B30